MKNAATIKTRKLPMEYEERLARIYSHVVADVNKAVTLIHMTGSFEPPYILRKRLSSINPFYGRQSTRDFIITKVDPLFKAGALDWLVDGKEESPRGPKAKYGQYRINEEGSYLVAPIAAHALWWFYNNTEISPRELLGKHSGHSCRPPYQKVNVLSSIYELCKEAEKARQGKKQDEVQDRKSDEEQDDQDQTRIVFDINVVSKYSGLRKQNIRNLIRRFETLDILSIESKESTEGFAFYRWLGGKVTYPTSKYVGEKLTRQIVDYIVANNDLGGVSPTDVRRILGIEQRSAAYNILFELHKQGKVKKREEPRSRITISPRDALEKYNDFFSEIEEVVMQSLEGHDKEKTVASPLLKDMQAKQRFLTDGSKESKKILQEMLRRYSLVTDSVFETPEKKLQKKPELPPGPQRDFGIKQKSLYM